MILIFEIALQSSSNNIVDCVMEEPDRDKLVMRKPSSNSPHIDDKTMLNVAVRRHLRWENIRARDMMTRLPGAWVGLEVFQQEGSKES